MNNFSYYNPTKLVFGRDIIKGIGQELAANNVKKVLMLYGKGSIFKNGVYDTISASLKDNKIEWFEVGGVKANPVISKVREAISVSRENDVDAIVCLGGGSVYDSAKAIAAAYYHDGDAWDLFAKEDLDISKALPIYGVLTISATGSEMNCGGVVTNEETLDKWSFGSPLVFPKVSFLDPSIQSSLPEKQTINSIVDILTHLYEFYFDGTKNVDLMMGYTEAIMKTTIEHGKVLLKDPSNYEARAELALSGTLALNRSTGMGRSGGDWSTHLIEHALSAIYDISHGAGLAIVFPAWAKYVYKDNLPAFVRFAENIFNIKEGTDEEKALKGIDAVIEFYKSIGAPTSLKDINVGLEDIDAITENAARIAPFGTVKPLYKEDIYNILKLAL